MIQSEPDNQVILVTGATGRQGGAVARSLLGSGFAVRSLVRDPQKPGAEALAGAGTELARGDLDDPASIERALEGAYGVFSVQNFFQAGYEGEIRQGTSLADVAKAAGVSHFVYSSVGSAHRETGISHFESKRHVEEHVLSTGIPYTIVRPVFFMHNWDGTREQIIGGTFPRHSAQTSPCSSWPWTTWALLSPKPSRPRIGGSVRKQTWPETSSPCPKWPRPLAASWAGGTPHPDQLGPVPSGRWRRDLEMYGGLKRKATRRAWMHYAPTAMISPHWRSICGTMDGKASATICKTIVP
jgi:hypothetical protein